MNIQGSVHAQLQNKLFEMVKNTGEPLKSEELVRDAIKDHEEAKRISDLRQELVTLSQDLNREMRNINTDINFSYSDEIKGLIVTVKDGGSGKIIREIPSGEAIELMRKMRDVIGNIFDKKA